MQHSPNSLAEIGMSDGYFGYGEVNEFHPNYAGVDWREAYERRMEEQGRELPKPAWFESEDDLGSLQEQLTQETFTIYKNATNPDMDVIAIYDPRDSSQIFCTRSDIGDEEFKKIYDAHATEALLIITKYPLKLIAEFIMARANIDIQQIDTEGLPDDFKL